MENASLSRESGPDKSKRMVCRIQFWDAERLKRSIVTHAHDPPTTRVKVTGLAQKLGQLEAVNRDLQTKSWANLKLLGQPRNVRTIQVKQAAAVDLTAPQDRFGEDGTVRARPRAAKRP
jgi:hypothetical protein